MFHIVIDGYNVIHASRGTDFDWMHLELEKARDALLLFLASRRRPARERITVVFDGSSGMHPRQASAHGVEVLFSEAGVNADEVICKMVAGAPNPRAMLVVSDDRAIRTAVLAVGAKVVSSRNFLHRAEEESQKRKKAGPPEPPEKTRGTSPGEVKQWRRILGFDEDGKGEGK